MPSCLSGCYQSLVPDGKPVHFPGLKIELFVILLSDDDDDDDDDCVFTALLFPFGDSWLDEKSHVAT